MLEQLGDELQRFFGGNSLARLKQRPVSKIPCQ